jgi:hypothetical protein
MQDYNGFDLSVIFEEDSSGTIAYFINWLQRKIMSRDGTYRSQNVNRIDHLVISTEDEMGIPIQGFHYKNIFFQNASDVTLDYSEYSAIQWSVVFCA